jgi:hypothetical protein
MERLIQSIENTATLGFTRVTEQLLNLTFDERRKLSKLLRKHEKKSVPVRRIENASLLVEVSLEGGNEECMMRARRLAETDKKVSVVLSLKPGCISVMGCGLAAPSQ